MTESHQTGLNKPESKYLARYLFSVMNDECEQEAGHASAVRYKLKIDLWQSTPFARRLLHQPRWSTQ